MGTVGHLIKLTRLKIGPYSLENAKNSDNVNELDLIPIEKMLNHIPSYFLDEDLAKKACNGMHFRLPINHKKVILKDKDGIIAVYEKLENDASNMDKGLKYRHHIYVQNKKKLKKNNKSYFEENFYENPFINF